ncbi:MAG: hypothetical protein O7E57_06840 [Gammaproteobacteria bacterium]|nr:hypothetical protein [Gammaproteobacteria bacterium]
MIEVSCLRRTRRGEDGTIARLNGESFQTGGRPGKESVRLRAVSALNLLI